MKFLPYFGMACGALGLVLSIHDGDAIMAAIGTIIVGANAWLAFYA